jgi:hypothetical protein
MASGWSTGGGSTPTCWFARRVIARGSARPALIAFVGKQSRRLAKKIANG